MAKPQYPYVQVETAAGKKATIFLGSIAYMSGTKEGGNVDIYFGGLTQPLQVKAPVSQQILDLVNQHQVDGSAAPAPAPAQQHQ